MFDPKNRIHWLAVIVIAIILILIVGVTSASGQEQAAPAQPYDVAQNPCGAPAYFPHDTEPRMLDWEALRRHLITLQEDERPEAGGRVLLWVCVFETGHVGGITMHTSSSDPVLDSIAVRVVANARFTPASNRGRPTTVWIPQPVDFIPRAATVEL